ncbi:histidine phosphatase family protein [Rhodoblastus acidophilus]|nr:histidine phosphatase family protein [Rhodoblastus acidophilus]RAI16454.1 histidine phosphatase family protein [Rhodoblastus acidophilus]
MRFIGFPADEALDPPGRNSLTRLSGRLPRFDAVLRSPALSAAQTAEGLDLEAAPETSLRDCDFGRWSGRTFEEIQTQDAEALVQWISDPHAAPHGGESFADVHRRVGAWMEDLLARSGAILAITHPTIVRAAIAYAIGAGPDAFRRIDVAPLGRAVFSGVGGWTFRALVPAKATD